MPVAIDERRTVPVLASTPVIDPVAIASVQGVRSAKPPNRALDETRKARRKFRVELARVNATGQALDDLGTAVRPVAGGSIRMCRAEPPKGAGPMEEVVDEGIHRDHRSSGRDPPLAC